MKSCCFFPPPSSDKIDFRIIYQKLIHCWNPRRSSSSESKTITKKSRNLLSTGDDKSCRSPLSIENCSFTTPFLIDNNYYFAEKKKKKNFSTIEFNSLFDDEECSKIRYKKNQGIKSTNETITTSTRRDMLELGKACPKSTEEERYRFLVAKKGLYDPALKQLQSHMEWREKIKLVVESDNDTEEVFSDDEWHSCTSSIVSDDEYNWNSAAISALIATLDTKEEIKSFPILPRLARFDDIDGNDHMLSKDGNRIVQVLPAQLDTNLASAETYVLCIALYLDNQLSRTSLEKITVCLDVRGGYGWPNPSAQSILPFIKGLIHLLEINFPERLSKCIVYPLPFAATALWRLIKVFLDPTTASKIAVISGPASKDSLLPYTNIEKYVEKKTLDALERNRSSMFNSVTNLVSSP